MNKSSEEKKIQFILDENGKLTEMPKEDAVPVEYPIKVPLKNAFEVFVRIKGTENYWISNYGRCVNNLNHKDKNTFYMHKQGNVHLTIFEIERYERTITRGKRKGEKEIEVNRYKRETAPDLLVAESFLVQYKGRGRVWHKDGDFANNWYKNLIYVSKNDFTELKAGRITLESLGLEQEYIEYENKSSLHAFKIYDGILARCRSKEATESIHKCYNKTAMWDGWLNDPKSFVKWYLEHYYECGDEEMDVDKDLFGDGSGMYHPDYCCILPKGLNTLLANSKKHYKEGETPENTLPLGVRYNSKTGKYYGEITFTGDDRARQLSYWDTPEEAFAEYKAMKQADILVVAAQYKDKIPDYIYKQLLKIEVKPY